MGDDEPVEQPEGEAPPAEEAAAEGEAAAPEAAAAAPTVDEVKALPPGEALEKHPKLKEKYESLEGDAKEGIIDGEGEEAAWGEKAGDFLEENKGLFEGAAAAEAEAPPPEEKKPLEKVIKVLTMEEVNKVADEKLGLGKGAEELWAELEKLQGAAKALDKLSPQAMNKVLDCTGPADVVSLGMTCRDMFTKYGKPRMKKEQMRWQNGKGKYGDWEKSMGGPLWDFPEGTKSELDPKADELIKDKFVELSKAGHMELTHEIAVPTPKSVHKLTYEAIVRRALGSRLEAQGLKTFSIDLSDYKDDGSESTFTVKHKVLEGEKEQVLANAQKAVDMQMEIKALAEDLKAAKAHVASAILQSQSIQERAQALKGESEELKDVDASEPVQALRQAAKEPMEQIRETLVKLGEACSDEVFAKKVAGGSEGEGKQKDYRVNLAGRLRLWLEVQAAAIVEQVEKVNKQLLDQSMTEANCTADTDPLTVKAASEKAPEFLDLDDAIKVLSSIFEKQIEKSLGDSASVVAEPGDDTVKWTVKLDMDV